LAQDELIGNEEGVETACAVSILPSVHESR